MVQHTIKYILLQLDLALLTIFLIITEANENIVNNGALYHSMLVVYFTNNTKVGRDIIK